MADVSVEFGAVDVGLDKTLKSIQDEIKRLEGSVKSGNLPLEDLKGKMKEIGQLTSMEKRIQAMGEQSGQSAPKVDALGKDIKAAGDKSEKMGEQSGIGFGKLAAAVGVGQLAAKAFTAALDAAFSAVQGTIQGFRDALDLGGRLSDLSAASGETAGNLLLLERAFDNSGAGAEKVGPALAKLQDKINSANEGSTDAAVAFGRMGISMDEMAGKTPAEQLALVASGITSIEDPTKRAATAIDLFGKSGAELLPLLTNFQGEMTEAAATVGSMAEIMDRRSNVFDAVSDRFKVIQEKVRDFAAGILDRALPAIDAITSALSRIDAAAVGQKLADAFLGGEQAMKGFQAAVDAISIGQVGLAFEIFWESLKLQAMQTADAIYKNLVAGFQTASDFISQIFRADGPALSLIKTSFGLVGSYISEKLYTALADFMESIGRMGMAEKFRYQAETSAKEVKRALDNIPVYAGIVAQDAGDQLGKVPENFKANMAEVPPLFDGITAQQAKVAELEGQVTTATAATNAERANGVAATEAELQRREEIRAQAEAAAAQAKSLSLEIVELETALNEAKALGNEELTKSLEKQLEQKKANEEIAKLTTEYQKTLGVTKTEAAILAENFVNAKNAAAAVQVDKTTVADAKKEAEKAATAAQSFASWLDYIKGVDPSKGVKSTREQAAEARKEIEAFGEYVGMNLSRMTYPDIAKKLGIDTMGMTGKEQMNAILEHIASKRGELTGIQPIDEKGGRASLENLTAKIASLGTTPQTITLDASKSIETIKGEFKKNMDLAISTGEGSKILGEIRGFVETIKILVEKIEPKLPTHALA